MRNLMLCGLLTGCLTQSAPVFHQCELDLTLDTDAAQVGAEVTATGRPLTSVFDTSVRVGGADAEIVDVDRPSPFCEGCDQCRIDSGCNVCETCDACELSCVDCIEVATFAVPDVEPGDAPVVVSNGYGTSWAIPFEVLPSATEGE